MKIGDIFACFFPSAVEEGDSQGVEGILMRLWDSFVAQMVKNLPVVWETWVRSLGWEDPLEKKMATHFSILAWRVLWTEESGELQSIWGHKESDMTE